MSSKGQKVTTDPRSNDKIDESVGVVTSDSLAAESLKDSGSFGEGNIHAAASKQPSKSTNTNNTDISGATKLEPAANASVRNSKSSNESEGIDSGKGQGKDAGKGPTYATSGSTSSTGVTGASTDAGGKNNTPTAPTGSYAGSAAAARGPGELKPKGKNITETDDLEGKHEFGEVGTEKDPGRAAELAFQKKDAVPASTGKDTGKPGAGAFEALEGDQAL
ncbi:hypothetical protein BDV95DRAFT_612950 [Massariosphaeria phaeospora]|uniref:Uncharacterized protein n=1 Tax=Massariosphaeria phaeospora TaxID=100035 RepID=A0A7C8M203_9PLEO|nr:hypothetical protein BDV95DRAFT_612950 [Massariosphaeria phaeospora]